MIYTFGQRGAEEALPAAHRHRATSGGARAIPSRARAPTSPRSDARPCATATTTSSTARRPGPRSRSTPTGSSAWCAPIPPAKQQEGISFLLIDMKTPGVTVRPIITIDGGHEVNEVFLDNVKVPVENLIGEENEGWTYAKFLLGNERTRHRRASALQGRRRPLKELAATGSSRRQAADRGPDFRAKLAELEIELLALEFTELRALAARAARQGHRTRRPRSSRSTARNPAAHDRAGARGGRAYAAPYVSDGDDGAQRDADRTGPRRSRRSYFNYAQGRDLRRLQRDPAQHHRQDGAGALGEIVSDRSRHAGICTFASFGRA